MWRVVVILLFVSSYASIADVKCKDKPYLGPTTGQRVRVLWKQSQMWIPGKVENYDEDTQKHMILLKVPSTVHGQEFDYRMATQLIPKTWHIIAASDVGRVDIHVAPRDDYGAEHGASLVNSFVNTLKPEYNSWHNGSVGQCDVVPRGTVREDRLKAALDDMTETLRIGQCTVRIPHCPEVNPNVTPHLTLRYTLMVPWVPTTTASLIPRHSGRRTLIPDPYPCVGPTCSLADCPRPSPTCHPRVTAVWTTKAFTLTLTLTLRLTLTLTLNSQTTLSLTITLTL